MKNLYTKCIAAALACLMTAGSTTAALKASGEESKLRLYGDMNSDGTIASDDALDVLRLSISGNYTDEEKKVADVDFDGSVTSNDAMLVLRESVGIDALPLKGFDTGTRPPVEPIPGLDTDESNKTETDTDDTDIFGTDTDNTDIPEPDTDDSDFIEPDTDDSDIIEPDSDEPDTDDTDEPDTDDTDETYTDDTDEPDTDDTDEPDTDDTDEPDTDDTDEPDTDDTDEPDTDDIDTDDTDTDFSGYVPPHVGKHIPYSDYYYRHTDVKYQGADLTENVRKGIHSYSVDLFKNAAEEGENQLLSPLSSYTAFALANIGAAGNTRDELMNAFGGGQSFGVDELNQNMNGLMKCSNRSNTFKMANALFIMDNPNYIIEDDFIKAATDDYYASVFRELPNNDTVDKINNWVSIKTNEHINNVLPYGSLTDQTAALIVNTAFFDKTWYCDYEFEDTGSYDFTNHDGSETEVKALYSEEYRYIEDDNAIGFIKDYSFDYADTEDGSTLIYGSYSFVAILPDEDVGIDNYIKSMNGDTLDKLLESEVRIKTYTAMPKFKYDCEYYLDDPLKEMGVKDVFSPKNADLSGMCKSYPLYVEKSIHKTTIKLDEKGTQAAAASIIWSGPGAPLEEPEPTRKVYLDRPFIYVLYDNINDIPLFIGAINDMSKVEIPITDGEDIDPWEEWLGDDDDYDYDYDD